MRMHALKTTFALALLVLTAGPLWARGGGGCLAAGTQVATPAGSMSIERLRRGDTVWTVHNDCLVAARVDALQKVEPNEFIELAIGARTLRLTREHPVQTAPGVFTRADALVAGDAIYTWSGRDVVAERLRSVRRLPAAGPAYNLLVYPGGTYLANGVVVHNKGCFLPETPVLRADGSSAPIRLIKPGDQLLAFEPDGGIVHATVQDIVVHEVDDYLVLATEQTFLRVTAEHPFYVGSGRFRIADTLHAGDIVFAYDGHDLAAQSVREIRRVHARTRVYNLQTDHPHTFFADGIAVHNKGGGCFPAGTLIDTPHGRVPIEELAPGDAVVAVAGQHVIGVATVRAVLACRARILVVQTECETLRTTAEHPVELAAGGFRLAGDLHAGDRVLCCRYGDFQSIAVRRLTLLPVESVVFNLEVDRPHTFIADGFVVHNKGGGFSGGWHGGGGGWRGSGSVGGSGRNSGSTLSKADMQRMLLGAFLGIPIGVFGWHFFGDRRRPGGYFLSAAAGAVVTALAFLTWVIALIVIILISSHLPSRLSRNEEDLDYVFSETAVKAKAAKTEKLLEFIARQDPGMAPEALRQLAGKTFLQLQQCWEARDYEPLKPLLMPDLFAQHTAEIRGLIHNHEINRIANLQVERVDLVGVRYTDKPDSREFTALITAQAQDFYEDDRTHRFLRGDREAARFQEFWTFHFHEGAWLLREVEQSRESDVLKEENFAEMFTDQQIHALYREAAGESGPAGPWLEKEVETKATRIDRLLNFLVQTDKLWDQKLMKERARQVFLDVYLAPENGDPAAVPAADLFPGVAEHLRSELQAQQAAGRSIEFRNLCVRKVELILVRNFSNKADDEFTVRISAHAQRVIRRNGVVIRRDEYVSPFEEYWTLGRLDGVWKLKEVLPPARGRAALNEENVDEGTGREQLEWFYRHTRAN